MKNKKISLKGAKIAILSPPYDRVNQAIKTLCEFLVPMSIRASHSESGISGSQPEPWSNLAIPAIKVMI